MGCLWRRLWHSLQLLCRNRSALHGTILLSPRPSSPCPLLPSSHYSFFCVHHCAPAYSHISQSSHEKKQVHMHLPCVHPGCQPNKKHRFKRGLIGKQSAFNGFLLAPFAGTHAIANLALMLSKHLVICGSTAKTEASGLTCQSCTSGIANCDCDCVIRSQLNACNCQQMAALQNLNLNT